MGGVVHRHRGLSGCAPKSDAKKSDAKSNSGDEGKGDGGADRHGILLVGDPPDGSRVPCNAI
ncbi:hypothetical protein GCM10007856_49740 [Azospirillum oryzae]|nr:hypothetical protein GCM10007856_49740 [Azospirillum oryzae]